VVPGANLHGTPSDHGPSAPIRRYPETPTVRDRVVMATAKVGLEPIFEADFLPSSYGFRPKRSAHQALEAVRVAANRAAQWVLDVAKEVLNPVLCGWGEYFRYGNSSRKFNQVDGYVHLRMAKLASVKHGLSGFNWATRFDLRVSHEPRDLPADGHGALPGWECVTEPGRPTALGRQLWASQWRGRRTRPRPTLERSGHRERTLRPR
jgi:Group II intron, maturase-specific domain